MDGSVSFHSVFLISVLLAFAFGKSWLPVRGSADFPFSEVKTSPYGWEVGGVGGSGSTGGWGGSGTGKLDLDGGLNVFLVAGHADQVVAVTKSSVVPNNFKGKP